MKEGTRGSSQGLQVKEGFLVEQEDPLMILSVLMASGDTRHEVLLELETWSLGVDYDREPHELFYFLHELKLTNACYFKMHRKERKEGKPTDGPELCTTVPWITSF